MKDQKSPLLRTDFDNINFRRKLLDENMVVHCHHYNARLQGTVESSGLIDGKSIIRTSAETTFAHLIGKAITNLPDISRKWEVVQELYQYLGFGKLDFSKIDDGVVEATDSHFVQGWSVGFENRCTPVCTFTEGYIQGAYYAIHNKPVDIRETACMMQGAPKCSFEIIFNTTRVFEPLTSIKKPESDLTSSGNVEYLRSPNVNEDQIVKAVQNMPIYGNENGLIPLFNVYLSSMPADFYNIVSFHFFNEMKRINLVNAAEKLLRYCGEVCGLYTFRGIMESSEWEGLIEPSIREEEDKLFAITALSNGFGWGNWHITKLLPKQFLRIESTNGYEAFGLKAMKNVHEKAMCNMLTGLSAGIMELIYGIGSMENRFGTFHSVEDYCICKDDETCQFSVTTI